MLKRQSSRSWRGLRCLVSTQKAHIAEEKLLQLRTNGSGESPNPRPKIVRKGTSRGHVLGSVEQEGWKEVMGEHACILVIFFTP